MGIANVLVVLFIALFFCFASSNSSCVETEWKALMDFKGSLVDEHNQLSSWTGRDCCSWEGITCHNLTGFVQMIDLNGHIGGRINSSLLQLEHLEYLDLSLNNFSGIPIPEFLGSLSNLQYLDLHGANFSGEIPQQLGNLSNLHHLSIGAYEPDDISYGPDYRSYTLSSKRLGWITGLSSLRGLYIFSTNLSECDDWLDSINMLSSLSTLRLCHCGLVGMALSRDLNLTSLVEIDLRDNNLNSLPPSFFNLTSLVDIRIPNCDLQGPIPNMFHKLTSLNHLDLHFNSFSSPIPDSLCTLTALTNMDLTSSYLLGSIPVCFGNLTNLTSLLLEENQLSGTIPGELGSLTQLTNLTLNENQLSGKIPSTLGKLTKLKMLRIYENSLIGELSESFFDGLKSLEDLMIAQNQFIVVNVTSQWIPPFQIQVLIMESVFIRTQFPAWLQTQANLFFLSLRNTSIHGVIPGWCQTSYPRLKYFDVSNNFLTGPIPAFHIGKATITALKLSGNQFTGHIPDALCNLHSMQYLYLDNNQLVGRIPSCLGSLKNLYDLDLSNNRLSDHIPNEIGNLNSLRLLCLNGNNLVGELPSSLQNLTWLISLDLGKNEFEGFIPSWIGKEFLNLEYLMLQSNKFSGEISVNLCQLPSLRILNLPDNSLVGTIPPCLGNLSKMLLNDDVFGYYDDDYRFLAVTFKGIELTYSSSLRYAKFISLSGNHLHGEIPDELMDLTELQSLNLSNNKLSGKIPERIGNMKHLESLDLSRNQLSGTIPQSLADIDSLEYLKLSFNNLSGRIPSGGHFDTFDDPSVYKGNTELCGKPTTKTCDEPSKQNGGLVSNDDDLFDIEWICAGIGPGFAVGFFGVFCLLYFKSSWRYAFFRFLENMYYKF